MLFITKNPDFQTNNPKGFLLEITRMIFPLTLHALRHSLAWCLIIGPEDWSYKAAIWGFFVREEVMVVAMMLDAGGQEVAILLCSSQ